MDAGERSYQELSDELERLRLRNAELEAQLADGPADDHFRTIMDATPLPVLLSRYSDGKLLYVNEQMAHSLGLPREQLIGRRATEFYGLETDRERVLALLEEHGIVRGLEVPARRADGTIFWVMLSIQVIRLRGERHILAGFADITAQRAAEESLRQSEERFRALADAAFEGVAIHEQGIILTANRVFAEMFGYTVEELPGLSVLQLAAPESRDLVRQHILSGYELPYEATGLRKDGTTFPGELSGKPILYENRWVRVTTGRDLTERKAAEARQRQFERNLLETQKLESLGVLAGGIAHDFNNLLVSVLGNASTILDELPRDATIYQPVAEIRLAAERAAELTRQLLAYAGKGQLHMHALSLNAVVEELGQLLRASISKRATLLCALDPGLPPIVADATQLRQVLMNLVINASEAIDDQSGTIVLRTSSRLLDQATLDATLLGSQLAPGRYVAVEVGDSGCGMDAQTLSKMFDPFFTTKFTGRGLGLSAVLGIIRSHAGTLGVSSQPGNGTQITIYLPVASEHIQQADALPAAIARLDETGTILVIDDEEGVRNVLVRMLQRLGFSALTASDGVEGLALLSAQPQTVRAILLDVTTPHMTPQAIIQEARAIASTTPVILISGYNEQDVMRQLSTEQIAAFLHKPFTLDELQQTLGAVLAPGKGA